jgi:carbamate kinase
LRGVEAVIDKDLASSLLARAIAADLFVLATGVERVAIGFNTPRQRWLERLTVAEARGYLADNEFDEGSMGPKIRALVEFLEDGGREGLVTAPSSLGRALRGESGTIFVR